MLLPIYKDKFESIMIKQNKKVNDANSTYDPADPNTITDFFNIKP